MKTHLEKCNPQVQVDPIPLREVCKVLKEKGYLPQRGKFQFTLSDEVDAIAYNNDLYICENENGCKVRVRWGNIRRRRNYYDVYLSLVPTGERYLAVVNNGRVEFFRKL